MALSFNASGSSVEITSQNSSYNQTFNATVNSGSSTILLVGVSEWHNAQTGLTTGAGSVSYNGVGLTKVPNSTIINTTANGIFLTEIWYLVNPASGTHSITLQTSGATEKRGISYLVLNGANQSSPIDATNTASGTGTSVTASVTTAGLNEWLFDAVSHLSANAPSANSGTSIYTDTAIGAGMGSQYKTAASSGTNSLSWTFPDNGDGWAYSVTSVKAAPISFGDSLTFQGTGTSTSIHLNNVNNGQLSLLAITTNAAATGAISSITDSKSNTYTRALQVAGTNVETEVWYCANAVIDNGTTITVTPASGSTVWSAVWSTWNNVASTYPVDKFATTSGVGGTSASATTATTVNANDIVFGIFGQANNRPFSTASGYSSTAQIANGTSAETFVEYQIVSSAAAQTASTTWDLSSNYTGAAIAFSDTAIPPQITKTQTAIARIRKTVSLTQGAVANIRLNGTNYTKTQSAIARISTPPVVFVQDATSNSAANYVNSTTVATTGNVTVGNTLVLFIATGSSTANAVTGVTDNLGNTWTKQQAALSTVETEVWTTRVTTGGALTVTAASGSSYVVWNLHIREYANVAASNYIDVISNYTETAYTQAHTVSGTTTFSNDVIISAYANNANATETFTLGTGFSNLTTANGTPYLTSATADKIVSSAGSQTATMTTTGYDEGTMWIIALKGLGGSTNRTATQTANATILNTIKKQTALARIVVATVPNFYSYGTAPNKTKAARFSALTSAWNQFKTNTFTQTGMVAGMPAGAWRVQVPDQLDVNSNNNFTNSEGIGYGMVAAVFMADPQNPSYDSSAKAYFDGFLTYYNYYKNSNGLMNWRIDKNGTVIGSGGATDGDEDVAFALVMAHRIFGSAGAINYGAQATTLINNIRDHEVYPANHSNTTIRNLIMNGDQWDASQTGSPDWYMPDYFAPGWYKEFYNHTGDSRWLDIIAANYPVAIGQYASRNTGLIPDNATWEGGAVSGQNFKNGYNSIRTFRQVSDYLWNGTTNNSLAYSFNNMFASFHATYSSSTPANLRAEWDLNGTTNDGTNVLAFDLPVMVAGMVNSSYSQFSADIMDYVTTNNTTVNYFSNGLAAVQMLLASGYMQPNRNGTTAANFTKTQTSIARIQKSYTLTQGSIARVSKSVTLTQPTIARISKAVTKTQGEIARIQKAISLAQTSIARVSKSFSSTRPAIARISKSVAFTQPANARLSISTTKTQGALARLQNSATKTQSAVANIIGAGALNTGYASPTTVISDSSYGGYAWVNPGNAIASDSTYATSTGNVNAAAASYYLKATGFGFSVPANAVIAGIIATVKYHDNYGLQESSVKVAKAGTYVGTDHATTTYGTPTDTVYSHGSGTDLWGATWTASDINNSGFGFAVSYQLPADNKPTPQAFVDQMQMVVYYTVPAAVTKTQSAIARIQANVTATQPTNARIQKSIVKTEPATARLSKSFTYTEPAIARLAHAFTKTQNEIARISKGINVTQIANARVAKSFTRTQASVSRVQKSFTKTQPTVASITNVFTKTQPAIATLIRMVTANQTATANIANTLSTDSFNANFGQAVTNAQTAIARIQITGVYTQNANARISKAVNKTQTSIARVANTLSLTQGAVARIAKAGVKTQSAISRIQKSFSLTQNSNARIAKSFTLVQSTNARISKSLSLTQTGVAKISKSFVLTQGAIGRISKTLSLNQTSVARVSKAITLTQPAIARVVKTLTFAQSANGRISKSFTKTQTTNARIQKLFTLTQSAIARVAKSYVLTQSAVARVANTIVNNQLANARLSKSFTRTQAAVSRLSKSIALTQSAVVRISKSFSLTQTANARIAKSFTLTQAAKSRIAKTVTFTQSAVANIVVLVGHSTTQSAIARVSKSITFTQSAIVRISKSFVLTQTSNARISKSFTLVQTAVSRIQKSFTLTQSAISRIAKGGIKTQPAIARVSKTNLFTQTANARLAALLNKTQASVARISKTLTTSQPANGRISKSFTSSQTANARLQKLFVLTQSAKARLSKTVSATQPVIARIVILTGYFINQPAIARILNTNMSAAQSAIARISKSFSRTQTAVARIAIVLTRNQPAIARITKVLTNNQTANGRISKSFTLTQTAISRLAKTFVYTQTSVARVSKSFATTQSAIGRIAKAFVKTQTSVARIANAFTRTQSAIARIAKAFSLTQSAVVRIAAARNSNQPAIARVSKSITKTQTSIARISKSFTLTQPANGRISKSFTTTQPANGRVSNSFVLTQSAISRIAKLLALSQLAVARIRNTGMVAIQSAIARIAKSFTKLQTQNARILNTNMSKTQSAVVRIAKSFTKTQTAISRVSNSFTKTQSSVARVSKSFTKTQSAIARITTGFTKTQSAIARIAKSFTLTQSAIARISKGGTLVQSANARVSKAFTKTQNTIARIAHAFTKTQPANARISKSFTLAQGAIARLAHGFSSTRPANARVSKGLQANQTANARISKGGTRTQSAIARVAKSYGKTENAIARIQKSISVSQFAIARIAKTFWTVQAATARIAKHLVTTQSAVARIAVNYVFVQHASALLFKARAFNQTSNARVRKVVTTTQTASAYIIKNVAEYVYIEFQNPNIGIQFQPPTEASVELLENQQLGIILENPNVNVTTQNGKMSITVE